MLSHCKQQPVGGSDCISKAPLGFAHCLCHETFTQGFKVLFLVKFSANKAVTRRLKFLEPSSKALFFNLLNIHLPLGWGYIHITHLGLLLVKWTWPFRSPLSQLGFCKPSFNTECCCRKYAQEWLPRGLPVAPQLGRVRMFISSAENIVWRTGHFPKAPSQ